jgi:hypothetical protein
VSDLTAEEQKNVRTALRFLRKVTVDDVLTGRFPAPGTCPHCGHMKEATDG